MRRLGRPQRADATGHLPERAACPRTQLDNDPRRGSCHASRGAGAPVALAHRPTPGVPDHSAQGRISSNSDRSDQWIREPRGYGSAALLLLLRSRFRPRFTIPAAMEPRPCWTDGTVEDCRRLRLLADHATQPQEEHDHHAQPDAHSDVGLPRPCSCLRHSLASAVTGNVGGSRPPL